MNNNVEEGQKVELVLSGEQREKLKRIGYTDYEIENYMKSAKNEKDVEFLSYLADGDYENAFKVYPGEFSKECELQFMDYETILATRASEDVFLEETVNQINALCKQRTYTNNPEVFSEEGKGNTFSCYISIIQTSMELVNACNGQSMPYAYRENIVMTNCFMGAIEKINASSALWDSVDNLMNTDDATNYYAIYHDAIRNGLAYIQIDHLTKDEEGQYMYQIKVIDSETGEPYDNNEMYVKLDVTEQPKDVMENLVLDENKKLKAKAAGWKQGIAVDYLLATLPFDFGGLYDAMTSAMDGDYSSFRGLTIGLATKYIKHKMNQYSIDPDGVLGNIIDNVVGVGEERVEERESALEEITENSHLLNMAQGGCVTQMTLVCYNAKGETQFVDGNIIIAENNLSPEVLYNMARFEVEGIDVFLNDLGIENVEAVKADLEQVLDPKMMAMKYYEGLDAEMPPELLEEFKYAVPTILNGGDYNKIPADIFVFLMNEIDGELNDYSIAAGLEDGFDTWISQKYEVVDVAGISNEYLFEEYVPSFEDIPSPSLIFRKYPELYFKDEPQNGNSAGGNTNKNNISQQEMTR